MRILTYDDITGDGAKHQLITLLKIGGVAIASQQSWATKWWQIAGVTVGGLSRIGDANVSSTNGIPIGANNNGQFVPPVSSLTEKYQLSDIWVILKSGDVYSVARTV